MRCGERGLLVLLRRAVAAGVGLDREVRHPTGDPSVPEPRHRPIQPAARHHVRHPSHRRRARRGHAAVGNPHRHRRSDVRSVCRPRVGPVVEREYPRDHRDGVVQRQHLSHGALAASGCRLHRSASRRHRHGIIWHPGDSVHRRASASAQCVPAQRQLQHSRRQRSARRRHAPRAKSRLPRAPPAVDGQRGWFAASAASPVGTGRVRAPTPGCLRKALAAWRCAVQ